MLAPANSFGPRHFHGAAFADAQRFGAWRRVLNRFLLQAEVEPSSDESFQAAAYLRTFPNLRLGWGSVGATINRRTRAIAAKDNDDLFLVVNMAGAILASRRGEESGLGAGDAYLMSCQEEGAFQLGRSTKLLCLRTQASAIVPLLGESRAAPRLIPRDNDGLRMLVGYVRLLDESQPLASPEVRDAVTRQVQDLLVLALGASGSAREAALGRSLAAVRLRTVKARIEDEIARPDLSPDAIASRCGLSRRGLQRLFEAEGTTFSEYLLVRRLARAHARLASGVATGRIGDIALASGFADISYFNRTFRARYHATPSDVRAWAISGGSARILET